MAISLNLNKFVVVQKGDALEKKDSIMSDLIESIIAAIYIDSNLDNAKFFIENKIVNNSNIKNVVDKHPKSLLQEYSLRYYKISWEPDGDDSYYKFKVYSNEESGQFKESQMKSGDFRFYYKKTSMVNFNKTVYLENANRGIRVCCLPTLAKLYDKLIEAFCEMRSDSGTDKKFLTE